jgi:hypothetical protein
MSDGGEGEGGDGQAAAAGAFGTAHQDAPVTRADFERALRHLNLADLDLRDMMLRIAAQVVALTDELVRRLDRVEPHPAPPGTAAPEPATTVEVAVASAMPRSVAMARAADERTTSRVELDLGGDKYAAEPVDIPCQELMHLCHARCCTYDLWLSTQDLDEGVIRFDYGRPYLIRQRASDGYCSHNDPASHACTVHAYRPRVCRVYDCREDDRVWVDYDRRIPAPPPAPDASRPMEIDLLARMQARRDAITAEQRAVRLVVPDAGPEPGPAADETRRRR